MKPTTALGAHLKRARAHRTQPQLSALLAPYCGPVHAGTISRYERGTLTPSARVLHAYAAALGLDASELLRLAACERPASL